jgi:hypothetical protein
MFPQYSQHLRDDDRGVADIHEGKVAEEEIHRGVEAVIFADQNDDSCIPQKSGKIETQK